MSAIQVKNVPEELHEAVRARAAREGVTVSEYVLTVLRRDLSKPSMREWLEEAASLEPIRSEMSSADLVREARRERMEELDAVIGRR